MRLCGVEYRKFPFWHYPKHVQNLRNYAWKPIIIHQLLTEYEGVLWLDSSISTLSRDLQPILRRVVQDGVGALFLSSTGHTNFAVTHVGMYDYLPTNTSLQKSTFQMEANSILLYRTETVYNDVIRWWTLCALDRMCIASSVRHGCSSTLYKELHRYANCHRFDQSALNIIMSNLMGFNNHTRYSFLEQTTFKVNRMEPISSNEVLNLCSRGTEVAIEFGELHMDID